MTDLLVKLETDNKSFQSAAQSLATRYLPFGVRQLCFGCVESFVIASDKKGLDEGLTIERVLLSLFNINTMIRQKQIRFRYG